LKALEDENRKLKKLLAEQVMDNATLKEMLAKKLQTPAARRSAVRWAIEEREYSQRRACSLIGLAPKVYRHRSRRGDDGVLRKRPRNDFAATVLLTVRRDLWISWCRIRQELTST
jgi:putative transposase